MEILESTVEGLKRIYQIKIPANQITSSDTDKVDEIQKMAKMPGFRPGKVPKNYLKQKYGASITGETINEIVRKDLEGLVEKEELRMVSQPKVDIKEYKEGEDVLYGFECEIFPDVTEDTVNYSKIKLTEYKIKVENSDIDKAIEKETAENQEFTKVEGEKAKLKKGLVANLNYKGFVDGEQFEGGTADNHQLEIGSGSFIDNFEDQLIGLKVGDEKKVKVKFPKEYHSKELEGKAAIFEVKINEILEVTKPEINDELAKKKGHDSVESYKKSVENKIKAGYAEQEYSILKKELFDFFEDKVDLALPETLVEQEFKHLINDYLTKNNCKTEEEAEEKDGKEFKKEKKETLRMAKRRVKVGLLLAELGRLNGVRIENDELEGELKKKFAHFPGDIEMLLNFYKQSPEMLENLKVTLMEDRVVELIKGKVSTKEKEVSLEQFNKIA